MPNFRIATVFTAKDRVSKALGKMSRRSTKFGDRTDKAFRKASKSASKFGTIVKGILVSNVIMGGMRALGRGIRAAGEEFVNFDDALTQASAKFGGIQRGSKDFDKLGKIARQVGKTTKFSAVEAAEGLNFLAMAGFNSEQAMAALPGTTNLAVVGNMDLARATDIASDALGAFGLMTKDSGKLTQNLTRINDVFAKTVTTANVDLEQLFESMKDGGPVATAAGASIETFSALVGTMGSAGIKGSKAGTTLKNMFLQLAGPTGAGAAQLKKFNIKTQDAQGNMRDMIDIIGDLQVATKGMGTAERSAAIDRIFGKRAIAGVNVLMDKGAVSLRAYRKELENSQGAAERMAAAINKSLGNQLLALKSALIEVGLKFFDAFKTKGAKGLEGLIEVVRKFDVSPIINGVNNVIDVFKFFKEHATLMENAIIVLTSVWAAYKIKAVAATAAQVALNIAMLANPVGLIIAGVGILIGLTILLVKHWDDVTAAFSNFGATIRDNVVSAIHEMVQVAFEGLLGIMRFALKVMNFVGGSSAGLGLAMLIDEVSKVQRAEAISFREGTIATIGNAAGGRGAGLGERAGRGGPEDFESFQSIPDEFATSDQSTFSAKIAFENMPAPAKITKQKSTGAPQVELSGLGANA